MTNNINIDEIRDKMTAKLVESGWDRILKSFIYSSDFDYIIENLAKQSNAGERFTPPLKYIFRAFEECPLDKLKIVIIGQDPYPQLGSADGIAFSCGLKGTPEKSLKFIFAEIERTIFGGFPSHQDPDLKRWANQGVLLLNTSLTTTVNKIGRHLNLWEPFIGYILDYFNMHHKDVIYIYMGKKARNWADMIDIDTYKFFVSHPASAAYNGSKWDCQDVFNKVNKILEDRKLDKINW
jgi:uracil-DNA glycosylase